MRPLLFDASVYIEALRAGDDPSVRFRRLTAGAALWLSAVVLEELYAGVSARDRHIVENLERGFHRAARILVPNLTDWVGAGKILGRLGARYGYEHIGRGRLTNDALIATSAGRLDAVILTANERDFSRLAEFRDFQFQLTR